MNATKRWLELTGRLVAITKEAIHGLIDSAHKFLETGIGSVGLYSPGTSERFQLVWQDTLATIRQGLHSDPGKPNGLHAIGRGLYGDGADRIRPTMV
jgi:hypothetical protein